MRVSAVKGTANYLRDALVTLDGVPQPLAVLADDVLGTVDIVDLEALENPERAATSYFVGRFPVIQRRGHVEIHEAP